MRARLASGLLALGLLAAGPVPAAEPQPIDKTAPVVMRADELTHDQRSGVVVALGNVEIVQNDRILMADKIVYDQRADTITASGNVTLLEPTGEVLFADTIDLSDELKEAVARNIRVVLTDKSRFAANSAVRTGGNRTVMTKAVYSPCRLCPDHPDRAPLWQLKAVRVVHDQNRQEIEYNDVFLEVFGVPVAYAPYFAHPDPTVQRRSGFLAPTYGGRSQLGLTVELPYFFNLDPHRDATFTPLFTSQEGVVLTGEYRERTENGTFQFGGSITRPKRRGEFGELIGGRDTRGHIEGEGQFHLNDTWRWDFELERSTDDTYLRRYAISSQDTLTSRVTLEGIRDRNYAAVNAYAFQGLEIDDDPGDTPLILPIADYQYISGPAVFGGNYTLDANVMALTRTDGIDSRRFSLTAGWRGSYIAPAGDIYSLTAQLRGDAYWFDQAINAIDPKEPPETGVTGRFVPLVAIEWRYPLIRRSGNVRQIIEPVAKFAISPYGGNPDEIPNEDSQDFEFDDTNLFSLNRFPGLDRVEGGPRLSYGVKFGAYGAGGGRTTAFIGESLRFKADSTFVPGSGLEDRRSDFVGRVTVSPSEYFDLAYRFRLDRNNLNSRRSEVDLAAGPKWLRLGASFLSLSDSPADLSSPEKREEFSMNARAEITPNWTLTLHNRRDLTNDATINFGGSIGYENECLIFGAEIDRRFTQDRDFEPETSLKFVIKLKHLG